MEWLSEILVNWVNLLLVMVSLFLLHRVFRFDLEPPAWNSFRE